MSILRKLIHHAQLIVLVLHLSVLLHRLRTWSHVHLAHVWTHPSWVGVLWCFLEIRVSEILVCILLLKLRLVRLCLIGCIDLHLLTIALRIHGHLLISLLLGCGMLPHVRLV